ncbi:hypothetical protein HNP84_005869 [Thermocatellispora tengchongensis]|uniref:Uncharacterized protein n=1 Tax=Thermocatellispora tengchongensis TaxID=1073253 RepID=A0A840PJ78_9ACTN|nr:hypothetical protein [Thermocatellispora tengchongensis]MBB5136125.1 hypothetical protein [Thermocatellispora tengchongensis]
MSMARQALSGHRRLHVLLGLQSLLIVLVSVNRRGDLALGFAAPNGFLRCVEVNNLLLALAAAVQYYLLLQRLEGDAGLSAESQTALRVTFVVGLYLWAAGYGDHEVTNYLNTRFCAQADNLGEPCRVIGFHDDVFSHHLFFAGFILLNLVVMFAGTSPATTRPLTVADNILFTVNALFVAAGITANLGFEQIGADLYVVVIVAVLAAGLLWRRRHAPILRYYTIAYAAGLLATVVVKML